MFSQTLWFQIKWLLTTRFISVPFLVAVYSFYTTSAKDGADISIAVNMYHLCNKLAEVWNMLIFAFVFTFCLISAPHISKFSSASKHIPVISTPAGPGRAKLIVLKDCHLTPFTDFVSVSSLMCRLASAPIINQVLSHDNQIPKGVYLVWFKCDGLHVDNDFCE